MYSGLISHSESSDDGEKRSKKRLDAKDKDGEQLSVQDKIENEDPDFMASDSPPDEFQSVKKSKPTDSFSLFMKTDNRKSGSSEDKSDNEEEEDDEA